MDNIDKMIQSDNFSVHLFADTVKTLKDSQGFYSRLYENMDNEKFDKHEMREYAKQYLAELGLKRHAILAIESNGGIPEYINNAKIKINNDWYYQVIREIPDYCGTPYIATIDNIAGHNMLTILCVSPYREDEKYNLQHSINNTYLANAYFINLDEPMLSELGTVTIEVDRQNQTLRRIY